jgi:hypothetical protein
MSVKKKFLNWRKNAEGNFMDLFAAVTVPHPHHYEPVGREIDSRQGIEWVVVLF